jgi:hypothetical protein
MPKLRRPDGSEINVGRKLPLIPKHLLEAYRAEKTLATVAGARELLDSYTAKVDKLIGQKGPRVPLRSAEAPAGVARQKTAAPGSGMADQDSSTTLPGGASDGDMAADSTTLGVPKLQPADVTVNYRYATDPMESCGQCEFFSLPGKCQIVAGPIRAVDTCQRWSQADEPLVTPGEEELPVEPAPRGAEEAAREFRRKYDSEDQPEEEPDDAEEAKQHIDKNFADKNYSGNREASAVFGKLYRDEPDDDGSQDFDNSAPLDKASPGWIAKRRLRGITTYECGTRPGEALEIETDSGAWKHVGADGIVREAGEDSESLQTYMTSLVSRNKLGESGVRRLANALGFLKRYDDLKD